MRIHRLLTPVILILLVVLSFHPSAVEAATTAGAPWTISTIDSNFAGTLSLALHPTTQKPYISYYSGSVLKLASPVTSGGDCGPGNSWNCSLLSSHYPYMAGQNFGMFSSAAFQPNGTLGISYSNTSYYQLQMMTVPPTISASSVITHSMVDTTNNTNGIFNSTSFGYDLSGNGHITYTVLPLSNSTTLNLYHATYKGSFTGAGACGDLNLWHCDLVTTDVAYKDLLGFQSQTFIGDMPILAYHNHLNRLSWAAYLGGFNSIGNCGPTDQNGTHSWICWVIDLQVSPDRSAVASFHYKDQNQQDQIAIAYYGNTAGKAYINIATPTAAGTGNCGYGDYTQPYPYDWNCNYIEAVDAFPSTNTNASLHYGVGIGLRNGSFLIAYISRIGQANQVLKVAYPKVGGNCGSLDNLNRHTWQCDMVDTGGTDNMGSYISLKVTPANTAYIAYSDDTKNQVKLAYPPVLPPPPPPLQKFIFLPKLTR